MSLIKHLSRYKKDKKSSQNFIHNKGFLKQRHLSFNFLKYKITHIYLHAVLTHKF